MNLYATYQFLFDNSFMSEFYKISIMYNILFNQKKKTLTL